MINLTVKTLDSQNHAFSLDDDQITVRGFKEHIAESVAVPADSQRLIYCGRVLQDEKKLNDYDVNGKVIHLVQRAPPQPGQRGNDGGQAQGQGQGHGQGWQNQQRSHYRLTRTQMHGNAMYLGAMSVPAEIVEGHGFPVPQLSNSLSNSRLVVARRMLDRVNSLLDQLDNSTMLTNVGTSEGNLSRSPEQVGVQELGDSLADAISATGAMFRCNTTPARGTSDEGAEAKPQQSDPPEEPQVQQPHQPQQPEPQQAQQSQQSQQPQQDPPPEQQEPTSSGNGQANRGGAAPQLPRPQQLAELLNRLLSTQDRLRPYLERYFVLMRTDPPIRPGIDHAEEYISVVTGVSEILHCLSHACHALSDIIVDMNQQPPRNLRCRPIIIQHSAILQAGIPIQLEAHISLHGRNANNNNTGEESSDNVNFVPPSDGAEASETAEASGENAGMQQPDSDNTTPLQQEERQQQDQPQTPFGAVFNLPNNVEVLMEVSPDSNIDGLATGEQNQQTEANNNNGGTGRVSGNATVFPWGSAPAPDFIRNVMQAVAGHMVQSQMATTTITTQNPPITVGQQTTPGSMDGTGANGGQSTQARSNVGTHPTTATQTRSTSRPHVFQQHSHPLGVGMSMGQGLDFDPFLSCNSHHIRRTPSTTPSTVTTASQTTTTNQTPAQESSPAQTQSASSSTASSSTTTANTTSSTSSRANGVDPLFNLLRQIVNDASGSGQTQASSINLRHNEELPPGYPDILTLLNAFIFDCNMRDDIARDRTLSDLLRNSGVAENLFPSGEAGRENNFSYNLYQVVTTNMTLESLVRCKHGRWEPIAQLRRPLQEFFEYSYRNAGSSSGTIQEYVTERLMSVIRRHLQIHLSSETNTTVRNGARVDLYATGERLVSRHISGMAGFLFDSNVDDARFGQEILNSIRNLGQQLCTVIRYSVHHGRTVLEFIASRFVFVMLCRLHDSCRRWLLSGLLEQFSNYCVRLVRSRESILPLLVYTDAPTQASEESASAVSQISTAQNEPEQMETEPTTTTEERLTNNASDPPEEDDTEDVPETFPGHENLPSGWVPIIARDGVRQRRQLQMQGMANGGVASFSDAYLGGLPSKRRKIIEQQKPRLPVSPTPNRTSVITASVECLVREGIGRAGVEEVEGAAVAVAADPGVRRAFGQAVRDCLNPHRYETPDFPDPLRFPNATKYFADQERSSKQ